MNEDNYYVLALCILSPTYLLPEQAWVHWKKHIPIFNPDGSKTKLRLEDWFDRDLQEEMLQQAVVLGSKAKASEIYGVTPDYYQKLTKRKMFR